MVSLLTIGSFALTGCGQNAAENRVETIIEQENGGNVDIDLSGDVLHYTINGNSLQVGENTDMPANFPSDVYRADGKVVSSLSNTGENTYWMVIETPKTAEETNTLYQAELVKNGWEITATGNFGSMVSITAEKENRLLAVLITTDTENNKTSVTLSESNN